MKDYRSLEQKIKDMYEANGTAERRKIENVGRPNDEKPTSEKSKLAKQGEIKAKLIDEEDISEKAPDNWEENSEKKRAATVNANVNKVNSRQGAVLMPHDKIHEAMKQDTPAKQDGDMDAMDAKLIKGGKTEVILDPKTDDRAEDTSTEDKTGQKALRAANKTIGQKGSGKLKEMFSAAELSHIMSILEAERKEPNFANAKKDAFAEPSSSSPSSFLSPMPGMGSQAGSKGNLGSPGRPAGVGGGKSNIKVEPTFGPAAPRLGGADSSVRVPTPKPSHNVSLGQAVKATGAVLGTTAAAKLGMDALSNRSSGGAAPDTSPADAPKSTTKADEPVSKAVSTRTGDSGSTTVYQTPKKTNNESFKLKGTTMSSEPTIFGIPISVINEISDFGKAFKAAREKAGGAGGEFEFGGKKFNTNIKGEPYKAKASAPKSTPTPPPAAAKTGSTTTSPEFKAPSNSVKMPAGSNDLTRANVQNSPLTKTYVDVDNKKFQSPFGGPTGIKTVEMPKPTAPVTDNTPKSTAPVKADEPKPTNTGKFTNRVEEIEMTDPIIENAMRALTMMARGRKDSGILEALKGKQHKIDANKNGKIDADDFEKLRKEEVEALDELDRQQGGILTRYLSRTNPDHSSPKEVKKRAAGRALAGQKRWGDKKFGLPEPKVKAVTREKGMDEEVEALDELSKAAVGSYLKKSPQDLKNLEAGREKGESLPDHIRRNRMQNNRTVGIIRGVNKLTGNAKVPANEEVEALDEVGDTPQGRNKLRDYLVKAKKSGDNEHMMYKMGKALGNERDPDNVRALRNRGSGIRSAKARINRGMYREEVEALDELDRQQGGILTRYISRTDPDRSSPKEVKKRAAGRKLAQQKRWGDKKFGLPEPKVKAVTREKGMDEEVGFSVDEIARIEEIAKDL